MNMHVTALVFSADTHPLRRRLEWDSSYSLRMALSQKHPVAFVVRIRDLARLRWFDETIIDRGRKNSAKALGKLLLGKKKVPLIEGSYSHPGQLRRSVRTLLAHAVARGERNAYIVGVNDALFDTLWKQSGVGTAVPPRRSAPGQWPPTPATLPPLEHEVWDATLRQLAPVQVPDSLLTSYLGVSAHTQLVRQLIVRAAASDAPVLITGATGSGKDVIVCAIHELSGRAPLVALNCAAMPRELIESELFGCEAGAFTGADRARNGLWKLAGRGTLFLDEIGDAPDYLQPKLLRALEQKRIRPLGAAHEVDAPARIVAATSRDLAAMIIAGEFRAELYFRLSVITIPAAPLSQRPEDIPQLAQFFWNQLTNGGTLPPDFVAALQSRPWPGNVRELKAVLTTLHVLFGNETLGLEQLRTVSRLHDLPFQLALGRPMSSAPNTAVSLRRNGDH